MNSFPQNTTKTSCSIPKEIKTPTKTKSFPILHLHLPLRKLYLNLSYKHFVTKQYIHQPPSHPFADNRSQFPVNPFLSARCITRFSNIDFTSVSTLNYRKLNHAPQHKSPCLIGSSVINLNSFSSTGRFFVHEAERVRRGWWLGEGEGGNGTTRKYPGGVKQW